MQAKIARENGTSVYDVNNSDKNSKYFERFRIKWLLIESQRHRSRILQSPWVIHTHYDL